MSASARPAQIRSMLSCIGGRRDSGWRIKPLLRFTSLNVLAAQLCHDAVTRDLRRSDIPPGAAVRQPALLFDRNDDNDGSVDVAGSDERPSEVGCAVGMEDGCSQTASRGHQVSPHIIAFARLRFIL